MQTAWKLLAGLLLLALPGRAQVLPSADYDIAARMIFDSTRVAEQALAQRNPGRAFQAANATLRRYPQRVSRQEAWRTASGAPLVTYLSGHPERLYNLRAQALEALADYRGAVADLDQTIRYSDMRYRDPVQPDMRAPQVLYQRRLDLKLRLRDTAAACADVAALWQMDTAVVGRLGWPRRWRCPLPARKLVVTEAEKQEARRVGLDSLRRLERLLAAGQYTAARRTADHLLAGEVGRFLHYSFVPPENAGAYWLQDSAGSVQFPPSSYRPGAVHELRARARQGLGDYPGALDDLDAALVRMPTRLGQPGDGVLLVARGQLKIRHLSDRAGGCADLALAYRCDTTVTRPDHPKWCGCPLPDGKRAIGNAEQTEAVTAYQDSLRRAAARLEARDYAAVLRTTDPLLRRAEPMGRAEPMQWGRVGRYIGVGSPQFLQPEVRALRVHAMEGLGDYCGAVAELDTSLAASGKTIAQIVASGKLYLQRGILKLDHLHDSTGCADLRRAYGCGFSPADGNWRGCHIEKPPLGSRVREFFFYDFPISGSLSHVSPQVGFSTQERPVLVVGILLSPGLHNEQRGFNDYLTTWGPSLGADVFFAPLTVAPRLSIEGAFAGNSFVGPAGRLDLTLHSRDGLSDLRLTPQLGLTLAALLNVYAGYAIPLRSERQPFVSPFRLTLTGNFLDLSEFHK